MKTDKFILIAASFLALASCQVKDVEEGQETVTKFYAVGEAQTRTQLGEGTEYRFIYWSPSDEINLFCKDAAGRFVSSNTEATWETVEFVGSLPVSGRIDSPFWAVYPYSEDNSFDGESVEVTLPSVQTGVADNVERGLMISLARSSDRELYFKNLFGAIRIGVYEEGIKRIVFKGNDGESLSGRVRATFDDRGAPYITGFKSVSQEITLLPPDGETFQTAVPYYIICFPGSFGKGYTIEFYRDELVSIKKIETPVTLQRAQMVELTQLYSGGIISSTGYNGKTCSLRYKVHPGSVNYWLTIDDRTVEIPEVFEETANYPLATMSPTMTGPAVAIDTENETIHFARPVWNYRGELVDGVHYVISSSGTVRESMEIGFYPYFRFDDVQKRLELHSFSPLTDDRTCWPYDRYHISADGWFRPEYAYDVGYGDSGYYNKTVSDIICLYHEAEPDYHPVSAVDLGLSVNWASCNLGAAAPERIGEYFAWGEIEPKGRFTLENYRFTGSYGRMSKYNRGDRKTKLDPEDDAASVKCGGGWRIPSGEEWQELIDNCDWEWVSINGVPGTRLTSRINGKSLFFPAGGCCEDDVWKLAHLGLYLSSGLDTASSSEGYIIQVGQLGDSDPMVSGYFSRTDGFSIRPVCEVPLEEIRLDRTSLDLAPGQTAVLNAFVVPRNATDKVISWSSSDESVATVTAAGEVTAHNEGTATVTAANAGSGKTASCAVTVRSDAPAGIPGAVDLGLSVKWATFNIGATKPEEYGDYYSWGNTVHRGESETDDALNVNNGYIRYNTDSRWGEVDNKTRLELEDDVAQVKLGGKWRMPSREEFEELIENCDWTFGVDRNGISGARAASKVYDCDIFFPWAGCLDASLYDVGYRGAYWSSSLDAGDPLQAYVLYVGYSAYLYTYYRNNGLPIRPVYDDSIVPVGSVGLDKGSLTLSIGEIQSLEATVLPADASARTIRWSSSDESVAAVSPSGEVLGVTAGSATITAASLDGRRKATCRVTVNPEGADSHILYSTTDGQPVVVFIWSDFGAGLISNRYVGSWGVLTFDGPVSWVGGCAFSNNDNLREIGIPETVTVIGNQAFLGCGNLVEITIPERVESIYDEAFDGCIGLTRVTVCAKVPPEIGRNCFEGSGCPIYVPAGSVDAYKSAEGWSTYADRIRAMP